MTGLLLALLVGCPNSLQSVDDTETDSQGDELLGILVAPETVTVPLGQQVQLRATGLRADRSTVDLTAVASWSSDAAAVATVSTELDHEGEVTGVTVGSANIVAGVGAVLSAPVTVKVSEAEVLGLTVEPRQVSVNAGEAVQLRATAAFSDGTRSDASAQVRWITSNGQVATVERGGLLTARATGQATITAEWGRETSSTLSVNVVQAARPDLSVESIAFDTGGSEVSVTLRVRNTGGVGASDYWLDLFLDPASPPQPGDLGSPYIPMFYTEAGETTEVVWSFAAEPGPHRLYVLVDSDNNVAESNENNNSANQSFEMTGNAGGPNLELAQVEVLADSESLYYAIDVRNGGGEAVGAFYIDLWVDSDDDPTPSGVGDEYLRVEGLAPGQTAYADFLVERSCSWCTSWVMADTNLEVEETDESDNVAGPLHTEPDDDPF